MFMAPVLISGEQVGQVTFVLTPTYIVRHIQTNIIQGDALTNKTVHHSRPKHTTTDCEGDVRATMSR